MIKTNAEPLYHIRYYIGATGALGQYSGLYTREEAEQWIHTLNGDRDNRALLMHHWIEMAEGESNYQYKPGHHQLEYQNHGCEARE